MIESMERADVGKLSDSAKATVDVLRRQLPSSEFEAVKRWLSTFRLFQLEQLLDWRRVGAMWVKARQIGASRTSCAQALLWSMLSEKTTFVSVSQRETSIARGMTEQLSRALVELGSKFAKLVLHPKNERMLLANVDGVPGGIEFASSTDDTVYLEGNVVLDEYAFFKNQSALWHMSTLALRRMDRLRVTSSVSPLAADLFRRAWRGEIYPDVIAVRRTTTIEEAKAEGYPLDLDRCHRLARGDQALFEQLFNCTFPEYA